MQVHALLHISCKSFINLFTFLWPVFQSEKNEVIPAYCTVTRINWNSKCIIPNIGAWHQGNNQ